MNRVWIEIEKPWTKGQGFDHALGHQRAKLISNLLKRLGVSYGSHDPVFYRTGSGRYCFTLDTAGGYVEAEDHGQWYNLDFLGKADDEG